MEPFHRQLAWLYWKYKNDQFTERDEKELFMCLKAHYHWAVKLSKLESLLDLTRNLGQKDWENEISRKYYQFLEGSKP